MNTRKKMAVVTGGARGIGLTIAKRFHAERHTVIILDRDQASLEATKEDIKDMDCLLYTSRCV